MFYVTYEIITPESAEIGDAAERGYVISTRHLRDAIAALTETRTSRVDCVSSIELDDWLTVNNGMEFETGAYESRSLHFPRNITLSSRRRVARLAGARV